MTELPCDMENSTDRKSDLSRPRQSGDAANLQCLFRLSAFRPRCNSAIAVLVVAILLAGVESPPRVAAAEQTAPRANKPSDLPDDRQYDAGSTPETRRQGEDWPRFLGPRDTGISGETGLLPSWPKGGPPLLWEKTIGTGYSAPSVRENRLVLHHRRQNEEIVECFAADNGQPVWRQAYPSHFRDPYGYNNGPRCTPLLTEDRCYTFGAEGTLLCLDLEHGKKIWQRDTAADWEVPQAFFGVGSTPILEGNLLIVMVGAQPRAGVVAFDKDTGKTVWQSVGKKDIKFPASRYPLDDKLASYSSLLVATIHGERHLLAWMRDGLVSLDPATGAVRFSYFFRSRLNDSVNAARPVVIGDSIFLSAAYGTGAVLLKVHDDSQGVDEVWKNQSLATHWSTTIYHEGFLYGFSGRHEPEASLRCVDVKTGEVVWQTEGGGDDATASSKDGLGANEPLYYGRGSAILAENRFIVLGERGLLALVEVNPERFKEISRFKFPQLRYPCWAAPVLSRKRIYLRSEDRLLCIDFANQAEPQSQ